jgi:hypothetical protein
MKHCIVAAAIAVSLTATGWGQTGHTHSHEGARQELGTTETAGLKVTATQVGAVAAGKEGIFEVALPKGTKAPKAIRVWVGAPTGEGSVKTKAENDGEDWEAHVEVPAKLAPDARLWVEVQPESGNRAKASFEIKK